MKLLDGLEEDSKFKEAMQSRDMLTIVQALNFLRLEKNMKITRKDLQDLLQNKYEWLDKRILDFCEVATGEWEE